MPVNAAAIVPDDVVEDGTKTVKASEVYENLTTYMWSLIKAGLESDSLYMLDVAKDNEMIAQITCRKYRLTSRGKIVLESKDDMKKRSLSSPDRADALALSLYREKIFNIKGLMA